MILRFFSSLPFFFYILTFLCPLILFPKTSEIFEFNKIVFVYVSTILVVASWITKMILEKRIIFRHTILDIPILIFLFSQIASTFFSQDVRTSIFGYYSRFNGGLLSTISYSLLYWAYVSNMTKETTKKVLKVFIASAYLVSAYAFLQRIGIDKDLWDQDVQRRVFSTFGQPNWLAAWISAVIPLTWAYLISNFQFPISNFKRLKSLLFISLPIIFFLTLLFTKSRSGLLAFIVSDLIFWSFVIWKNFSNKIYLKKQVLKTFVVTHLLLVLASAATGTALTPSLREVRSKKLEARSENTPSEAGTESGEIRKIVWKGAINIWEYFPLFGSGVETFAYSYPTFRPPEHNQTSEWEFTYNKAHNEYLNFASTTGTVGVLAYGFLIISVLYLFIRKIGVTNLANKSPITRKSISDNSQKISEIRDINGRILSLALFSGYASILFTNFFGFSTVATSLQFFLYPAFAITISEQRTKDKVQRAEIHQPLKFQIILILFVLCSMFYLLYLIARYWSADYFYAKGKLENDMGEYAKASFNLAKSLDLSQNEPVYYDELAHAYAQSAISLFEIDREFDYDKLADAAISHSDRAISLSPSNLNFRKSRARLFINLSLIEPRYLLKAKESLISAASLAPTDAKILYDLALTLARTGERNEAIRILQKTIQLKTNFRDARFTLALLLIENKDSQGAKEELNYILTNINPQDTFAQELVAEISN